MINEANVNLKVKNPEKKLKKEFEALKNVVCEVLEAVDQEEEKNCETECAICFNMMVESCILPCRHRFCIQCMRSHLGYQT